MISNSSSEPTNGEVKKNTYNSGSYKNWVKDLDVEAESEKDNQRFAEKYYTDDKLRKKGDSSGKMATCLNCGIKDGIFAGAVMGIISTGAMMLAVRQKRFNTYFGPSGKTALWISPPVFAFGLKAELTINRCSQNRGEFASGHEFREKLRAENEGSGNQMHPLAHVLIHQPLLVFGGLSLPIVGAIATNRINAAQHGTVMAALETRVLGQVAAILLLVGIFGFSGYLENLLLADDEEDENDPKNYR